MKKILSITCLILLSFTTISNASIVGNWRTESGETANISSCDDSYCIKLTTGTYQGKQIGKVKESKDKYIGTVTDPEEDKTYSGSATVTGSSLKLKGCALKIFCKTQTWTKM